MTSTSGEFETTERPTNGATEVRGIVYMIERSKVYQFTRLQTKVLMISQFLLYFFSVFVNNLAVSVQVRGSPNSKIISLRDLNRTSERAKSLELR